MPQIAIDTAPVKPPTLWATTPIKLKLRPDLRVALNELARAEDRSLQSLLLNLINEALGERLRGD